MLKQILPLLKYCLQNPRQAARGLLAQSQKTDWKQYVSGHHGYDKGMPVIDILDLLPDMNITISPYAFLQGGSLPIDLALLKGLAASFPSCSYLEIGTWRGESLVNVSEVADRCVSINLSAEEMREMGIQEEFIAQLYYFLKENKNIEYIRHNSQTLDYSQLAGQFDLVFIDGDHSKNGVEIDTSNAFQLLRDENSMIVWHDYGRTPEEVRWPTLAGILDGAPKEYHDNIYQVSNTLCAVYTKKELKKKHINFPHSPDKSFQVTMLARKI